MKVCSSCKLSKPLREFNRKGTGYQSFCRDCKKAWYKNYYHNDPKEKLRLQNKRSLNRDFTRKYLDEKKDAPCADCGIKYPPYVMDFDHIGDDKLYNVGSMRNYSTTKQIDEEIAKCDLVCSNCHRERTHQRRLSSMV